MEMGGASATGVGHLVKGPSHLNRVGLQRLTGQSARNATGKRSQANREKSLDARYHFNLFIFDVGA